MPITPTDLKLLDKRAANVYEAVILSGKKARIINNEIKQEYNEMLGSLTFNPEDEFEEKENPDQLRLALELDKREKPQLEALKKLLDGEIKYSYSDNSNEE